MAIWLQTSGKCCHQRWWPCSSETKTFKEILFITDRGQKGTQLLDPEDLQGYLACQAYQVMEKLDLLAHLDHLDHQAPLQYMAQVSFSVCMQVQPRAHNSHMTNSFISGRLSHLPTLSAYLNQVVPHSPPALHQFLLGGEVELRAQKGQFPCR